MLLAPDLGLVSLVSLLLASGAMVRVTLASYRAQRHPPPGPALQRVLAAAAMGAALQKRAAFTPDDVTYAALFDAEVERQLGGDVLALRGALAEHLAALPSQPLRLALASAFAAPSPEVSGMLARMRARARAEKRDTLLPADAIAAQRGAPRSLSGALLAELVVRAPANPPEVPEPPASSAGYRTATSAPLASVVLWDDDRTTMECVIDVLRECFAKPDMESVLLMLTTHQEGTARVGAFLPEEATSRVARALSISRARGMPLRITVESADFRPPARTFWQRARLRWSRARL